jgi:hypothetical protein
MLRIGLMIGVLALLPVAGLTTSSASEGPWCALRNFGTDLYEDCQYRSLEECRVTIVSGFRGFCNPNPRWQGDIIRPRPYRRG